jgi:hypothetical protein
MAIGINMDTEYDFVVARRVMSDDVIKMLEAEIKRYKRQDIILSEREINENKKIADILESLIPKIKDIV